MKVVSISVEIPSNDDVYTNQLDIVTVSLCGELARYLSQFPNGFIISHIDSNGVGQDWEL